MPERVEVSFEEMRRKITGVMKGVGFREEDAQLMADALIDGEVTGVESHGATRLKAYADRALAGVLNVNAQPKVEVNGAIVRVDADNGLGQTATCLAAEKCVALAKTYGISCAGIYNSNHFGTSAFYSNRIAEAGCIGFAVSDCGASVPPYGGMTPMFGTNPVGISIPAERETFCIDMSTSAVAKGKIRIYDKKGLEMPLGWAADAEGNDTVSPAKALAGGLLLPMAGHKGYGLAMAVDALCALLTGGALSCQTTTLADLSHTSDYAHFVAAIDIEHFLPLGEFKSRTQEWFDAIRATQPRPGMEIKIPGEPEARARAGAKCLHVLSKTMDTVNEYYDKYAAKE